jgi:hypothetical protein
MSARKPHSSEQISKREYSGSEPGLALSRLNGARAKRRASRSSLGVGMATLVTIMVAVLLTVFSVLTLVSAHSDLLLSSKAIQATQAYYLADSQAEQWLAEVDAIVSQEVAGSTTAAYNAVGTGGDAAAGNGAATASSTAADNGAATASGTTDSADIASALNSRGYQTTTASDGQLNLAQDFRITDNRRLVVELAISSSGIITVQKWQVVTRS